MEILPLIINLVSGAVGGNVFGAIFKKSSLGGIGNSIAGIAGGGIGGSALGMLGMGATGGDMSLGGIAGTAAGGLAGGGILMTVIGMVRKVLGK